MRPTHSRVAKIALDFQRRPEIELLRMRLNRNAREGKKLLGIANCGQGGPVAPRITLISLGYFATEI